MIHKKSKPNQRCTPSCRTFSSYHQSNRTKRGGGRKLRLQVSNLTSQEDIGKTNSTTTWKPHTYQSSSLNQLTGLSADYNLLHVLNVSTMDRMGLTSCQNSPKESLPFGQIRSAKNHLELFKTVTYHCMTRP